MKYNGTIYRPPREANTFLIPITEGCTHNGCRFCNMFKEIPFRMVTLEDVEEFLRESTASLGSYAKSIKRVYLVGANPFALSASRLLELPDTYYWAGHRLDSLIVEGMIGEEKEKMLACLDAAIANVDESAFHRVSRKGTM